LNYIKSKYASSSNYLTINGKPVIFVYNAADNQPGYPLNDLTRWQQVRDQTGFYVVMKVDPLSAGGSASSMDGWYQYSPTSTYDQQQTYSASASPGFWKYTESSPRLGRDVTQFESSVQKLASANVHFKLIETFNEWGEGTGVEP